MSIIEQLFLMRTYYLEFKVPDDRSPGETLKTPGKVDFNLFYLYRRRPIPKFSLKLLQNPRGPASFTNFVWLSGKF